MPRPRVTVVHNDGHREVLENGFSSDVSYSDSQPIFTGHISPELMRQMTQQYENMQAEWIGQAGSLGDEEEDYRYADPPIPPFMRESEVDLEMRDIARKYIDSDLNCL